MLLRAISDPHADQPSVRADLVWAAAGTEAYAAPRRDIKKAKRARDEDDDQ